MLVIFFWPHISPTHSPPPICSMYGIFTYIYPKNCPNVGKIPYMEHLGQLSQVSMSSPFFSNSVPRHIFICTRTILLYNWWGLHSFRTERGYNTLITWHTLLLAYTYLHVCPGIHGNMFLVFPGDLHDIGSDSFSLSSLIVKSPNLVSGWAPPVWKIMEFVSWDDEKFPFLNGKVIIHSMVPVTTNQLFSH